VLGGTDKVILESGQGSQGVVPYLPLPDLRARPAPAPAPAPPAGGAR
jgi:membrane protease subunit HflK